MKTEHVQIGCVISEKLKRHIQKQAINENISVANYIRKLLSEGSDYGNYNLVLQKFPIRQPKKIYNALELLDTLKNENGSGA